MEFLKRILSQNHETSCMRLMSLISLTVGSLLAFGTLIKGDNLNNSASVIGIFVGAAFGGKVWQKYAEVPPKKSVKQEK